MKISEFPQMSVESSTSFPVLGTEYTEVFLGYRKAGDTAPILVCNQCGEVQDCAAPLYNHPPCQNPLCSNQGRIYDQAWGG